MIITDPGLVRTGIVGRLEELLTKAGYSLDPILPRWSPTPAMRSPVQAAERTKGSRSRPYRRHRRRLVSGYCQGGLHTCDQQGAGQFLFWHGHGASPGLPTIRGTHYGGDRKRSHPYRHPFRLRREAQKGHCEPYIFSRPWPFWILNSPGATRFGNCGHGHGCSDSRCGGLHFQECHSFHGYAGIAGHEADLPDTYARLLRTGPTLRHEPTCSRGACLQAWRLPTRE